MLIMTELDRVLEELDRIVRNAVLEEVDTQDQLDKVEKETLLDMEHGRAGLE